MRLEYSGMWVHGKQTSWLHGQLTVYFSFCLGSRENVAHGLHADSQAPRICNGALMEGGDANSPGWKHKVFSLLYNRRHMVAEP